MDKDEAKRNQRERELLAAAQAALTITRRYDAGAGCVSDISVQLNEAIQKYDNPIVEE